MDNKFVKAMLVIIAGLLLLNCFDGNTPSKVSEVFGIKVQASVPSFIAEGNFYYCRIPGRADAFDPWGHEEFKIEAVDKESGWVKARFYNENKKEWEGYSWIYLNQAVSCFQKEMPAQSGNSNR